MKKTRFLIYTIFLACVAFVVAAFATLVQDYAKLTVLSKADAEQTNTDTPTAQQQSVLKPAVSRQQPEERRYRQRLGEFIAPLIQFRLSDNDEAALKAALEAIEKQDLEEVAEQREKMTLASGRTFVKWALLQSGYGRPEDYTDFLKKNPLWPYRWLMERRVEQSFLIDGGSANAILAHFKETPPVSDYGYAAMASAYLALGNNEKARKYAGKAWCFGPMTLKREQLYLQRFGKLFTNKEHTCRLNRLLVANMRWMGSRKTRAHAIRRVIKLLDKKDRKKATARLSEFLRQRISTKWMNAVPASQRKGDLGYAFQRIQHLRRKDKDRAAWKLLAKTPSVSEKMINSDAWWEERHANALNAIKAGKYKLAASFVNDIRPEGAHAAQEQAFFAGWLALRKRNRPGDALDHFKRAVKVVKGPLSTAKAHYWLGRTYAELGQKEEADKQYRAGAKYRDTFHGQLAAQTVEPDNQSLVLPLPALPNDDDVKTFLNSEAVQGAMIAYRLGLSRNRILAFFLALTRQLDNEAKAAMVGQLAASLGDGQLEVRIGKSGVARGFNMYIFSYPVDYLPDYEPLRPPPEEALVLAVARQESEFNTSVVSGAGARGILQIMPATARGLCRKYEIKCGKKDLVDKPAHSARLASAYIADRSDEFDGNYILTFTSYNAGPGRTRQWLRRFGDPRSPDVHPLDWIYKIPFEETRSYAQKVLSNAQVYRARLGVENPLRILDDMNRASQEADD